MQLFSTITASACCFVITQGAPLAPPSFDYPPPRICTTEGCAPLPPIISNPVNTTQPIENDHLLVPTISGPSSIMTTFLPIPYCDQFPEWPKHGGHGPVCQSRSESTETITVSSSVNVDNVDDMEMVTDVPNFWTVSSLVLTAVPSTSTSTYWTTPSPSNS